MKWQRNYRGRYVCGGWHIRPPNLNIGDIHWGVWLYRTGYGDVCQGHFRLLRKAKRHVDSCVARAQDMLRSIE